MVVQVVHGSTGCTQWYRQYVVVQVVHSGTGSTW
jgi:hypothetical protein